MEPKELSPLMPLSVNELWPCDRGQPESAEVREPDADPL
jgi:hypothetical protein